MLSSYTDESNNFYSIHDEELIPILLSGQKCKIKEEVSNFLSSEIVLKNSLSLVAYLYEVEEINYEIVYLLLESGVNPNLSIYGRVPLHLLYNKGLLSSYIDMMVSYNANLNIIDDNGRTLIQRAALSSDIEGVRLLLAKGASVLIQDNYGNTALSSLLWFIRDAEDDFDKNHKELDEGTKILWEKVEEMSKVTKAQRSMVEILDKATRKEMDKFGLLTEEQAAIQNWRCNY